MFDSVFNKLTVAQAWELLHTQFSLIGVICFLIVLLAIWKLIKRSLSIIHYLAQLPPPLLGGMLNVVAAGGFGYTAIDLFAKVPTFSVQTNGFFMAASATLALVALKYERQTKKE